MNSRWFLQCTGFLPSEPSRCLLRLIAGDEEELGLHLPLEHQLVILVLSVHRPPALCPLLLEQVHGGHRPVSFQHAQVALLGCLCSPGEFVQVKHDRTEEIILREGVCIPDLDREPGRNLGDAVIPREHALLLADHDLLLCRKILEREDKSPVEVSLARQGPVVDICCLGVLGPSEPALDVNVAHLVSAEEGVIL